MEQDQPTANQQDAAIAQAPTERFLREVGPAADLAALVEPVLEDMGFRLVRVAMSKRDGATIQIMADKAGGTIVVQDCADISRRLSPLARRARSHRTATISKCPRPASTASWSGPRISKTGPDMRSRSS